MIGNSTLANWWSKTLIFGSSFDHDIPQALINDHYSLCTPLPPACLIHVHFIWSFHLVIASPYFIHSWWYMGISIPHLSLMAQCISPYCIGLWSLAISYSSPLQVSFICNIMMDGPLIFVMVLFKLQVLVQVIFHSNYKVRDSISFITIPSSYKTLCSSIFKVKVIHSSQNHSSSFQIIIYIA